MSIAKTISINGGPPQLGTLTGNTTNWTFTITGTGPRPVPASVDVVITTSRGRYRGTAVIDDAKFPASRAVVRWTACIRSTGPLTRERDPHSAGDGDDREGSHLQRTTGTDD